MKIYKFILATTLILLMLVSLTSCIIIPRYKRYDDINSENVSSIMIYDLRECETTDSTFLKNEEPVYTLPDEKLKDFLDDLADIQFSDHILIILAAVDPSFNYGDWVARINNTDGTYLLISSHGYGEAYNSSGQVTDTNHYGCDNEEWAEFISRYLPSELLKEPNQSK
ncbi:MAG: hypothetical protein E7614_02155 [Ruminococcaceae bacterium]|nr:hypothetical protein [Oscillospiraceae bacterium]